MIRRSAIVAVQAEDEAAVEEVWKRIEKPRLRGPTVVVLRTDPEDTELIQMMDAMLYRLFHEEEQ